MDLKANKKVMNDLERTEEVCKLVSTEKEEWIIKMDIRWCARHMSMGPEMSTRLIYNILSAGIKAKEINKILKLLDDYKIEGIDYVNFINVIIKAINSNCI